MELLQHTDYPPPTGNQRRRRLVFLAAFLDDATVRDTTTNEDKCTGIYAGFRMPRLEVRNFAAMRISEILGTPIDPTPEWTAEQWGKSRDRLRGGEARTYRRSQRVTLSPPDPLRCPDQLLWGPHAPRGPRGREAIRWKELGFAVQWAMDRLARLVLVGDASVPAITKKKAVERHGRGRKGAR